MVSADGSARLCEAPAESSPPRCGGVSIAATDLPREKIHGLSSRAGARRTQEPVRLIGVVRAGTFVSDPLALAAS